MLDCSASLRDYRTYSLTELLVTPPHSSCPTLFGYIRINCFLGWEGRRIYMLLRVRNYTRTNEMELTKGKRIEAHLLIILKQIKKKFPWNLLKSRQKRQVSCFKLPRHRPLP